MKLFGWQVPFTKATDLNIVTPIRDALRIPTSYGTIIEAFGGMWSKNLRVDDTQTLLSVSSVYACISLISGDIGKLPLLLKRKTESKIWEEFESPAFSPVLRQPNHYQTTQQFLERWVICKLIWGNVYVLKGRDDRGVVNALYILDPQRVTPLVAPDGDVFYRLNEDWLAGVTASEAFVAAPAFEIIHDRHKTFYHDLVGVPPLYANALSGTQSRKIQTQSTKFFENMSRPSGMLSAPEFINDETAARLKTDFEKSFAGENIGRLLVAGNGLTYTALTMPAEHAQLIEQQKWTVEDICRPFHVPLYKIGAAQLPSSLSHVAALNQEYYQQALQPHMEAIENLLNKGLGLDRNVSVEFDIDGLVRMDPKTRAERSEILIRSAVLSPNEGRKLEDLPPVEGGDSPMIQQQNFSLAALAKRDAKPDPFATTSAAPAANDEMPEGEMADEMPDEAAKFFDLVLTKGAA